MNNTALIVAAAFASAVVACSAPAKEEAASQGADLVQLSELSHLEQNLGLVHDDDRVRSEETLQAGRCYQKLATGDASWDVRRYTKGAAFFQTNGDGSPMDKILCLDLDVALESGGVVTKSFEGLALDVVNRFPLGEPKLVQTSPSYWHSGDNDVIEFAGGDVVFDEQSRVSAIGGMGLKMISADKTAELAFTAYKLAEKGVNVGAFEHLSPKRTDDSEIVTARFGNLTIVHTSASGDAGAWAETITATTDDDSVVASCHREWKPGTIRPLNLWCPATH